jgi:HEAT repeat protein
VKAQDIDDKTLADIVSLLDSPDDSVRFWVAASLGHLGPRAKAAVPKLLTALKLSDCFMMGITSASAIRGALVHIGERQPPQPKCTNPRI